MNFYTTADAAHTDQTKVAHLAAACGIPQTLAQILYLRGYTEEETMRRFLAPGPEDLLSPYAMKDMDKAASRIEEAIANGEKILVYGDYDADGISATALLVRYFRSRGVEVLYRIPDRMSEGYGLSADALREISSEGVALIVTVDTGCTASEEAVMAHQLGIDMVVTDHHECLGELPECCAVVDPMRPDCSYPFKGLAGVGVAFKVACALEIYRDPDKSENTVGAQMLEAYGDLVAIGTIADVMPLTGENRYIVKTGLKKMNERPLPGLDALISSSKNGKSDVNAAYVGFNVAPRINAAGRMGDPLIALSLLLCDDKNKAYAAAMELSALNDQRKKIENKITAEAFSMLSTGEYDDDPILVLCQKGWHKGVLGIVASHIVEACKKPAFLLTEENGECCGSARGVEGYNLATLLNENSTLYVKGGGHEAAAGVTLKKENLGLFREAINRSARAVPALSAEERDTVVADMALSPFELTLPFAESLTLLEPCGSGNPVPQFVIYEMKVEDVIALSDGKHSKPILEKEGLRFTSLIFGSAPESLPFCPGDTLDVLFELSVNEFNGRRSIQLFPRKYKLSGTDGLTEQREDRIFSSILDDPASAERRYIPDREDFSTLYRYLRRLSERQVKAVSARRIASDCFFGKDSVMPRLMLEVLAQAGLIRYTRLNDGKVYSFTLQESAGKIDLMSTPLLRAMRAGGAK